MAGDTRHREPVTVGGLLRSAWKHAKKSRQYAIESRRLAGESMLKVAEAYLAAAGAHRMVMEAIKPFDPMEAARPYLEIAQLNADLAESWANTAEEAARQCRMIALTNIEGQRAFMQPAPMN